VSDSQLLPTDAAACKSVPPTPVEEEGVMCITEGFSCFPVLLRELLQLLFDPDHPTDIVPCQDNFITPPRCPQTKRITINFSYTSHFQQILLLGSKNNLKVEQVIKKVPTSP
jgi:hypothetical protein